MRIEVKVKTFPDVGPYHSGTAHVYIDGKLHAKLRTYESYVIETNEDYSTMFVDAAPSRTDAASDPL